ncbi:hypothetical protein [Mycolicibacter kumamotonensis]|uniref:hypothetical protein n=1 Tax=Mycolicibacter kumamotonensis TaxID=354243 RepID=UPI0013F4D9CC|nr:hypothetical protein [Mycolicibacter kumamotonensis]
MTLLDVLTGVLVGGVLVLLVRNVTDTIALAGVQRRSTGQSGVATCTGGDAA